jgi:dCTP deaminase
MLEHTNLIYDLLKPPTGLLSDVNIQDLCLDQEVYQTQGIVKSFEGAMITPFVSHKVRWETPAQENRVISYGLSSCGYDIRLGNEFIQFVNRDMVLDPKAMEHCETKSFTADDHITLLPNSFILARSMETFNMPNDVVGLAFNKSTYARVGIHCTVTPLEPGWCGVLTIEITNPTQYPVKLYVGEGIIQILFVRVPEIETVYGDGVYQDQTGVTLPMGGRV